MYRDRDRNRDRDWSSRSKRRRRDHEYWVSGGILSRVSSAMALNAPYLLKLFLRNVIPGKVLWQKLRVKEGMLQISAARLQITRLKKQKIRGNESLNGTEGTNSVKVVNGVAVVQGRTHTPVERFERRERLNSDEVQAHDTTPQIIPETAKISPVLNGHPQITERELTSANDGNAAEDLM